MRWEGLPPLGPEGAAKAPPKGRGGNVQAPALRLGLDWSDAVRSGLRDAKNVADAALTSGKMVLEEHNHRRTTIGRESGNSVLDLGLSAIEYPIQEFGEPPGDSDEEEEEPFSKDAIQEIEQKKAREGRPGCAAGGGPLEAV